MKTVSRLLLALFAVLAVSQVASAIEVWRERATITKIAFPMIDSAKGEPVTGDAANLDSEFSEFGHTTAAPATFADCTNEGIEIASSSGMYYLNLVAAELDSPMTIIIVKSSTAGVLTQTIIVHTTVGNPDNMATTNDGTTINVASGVVEADVEEWLGTAVNEDAAGYPVVTIKDGTGQGEILTGGGAIGLLASGAITNSSFTGEAAYQIADSIWNHQVDDKLWVAKSFAGMFIGDSTDLNTSSAAEVWEELRTDHVTNNTFGSNFATDSADIKAIKAKTDNLPSDPADASVVAGLIATVQTDLDSPSQYKADVSSLFPLSDTAGLAVNIANAVWDEDTTGHYSVSKYGFEAVQGGVSAATIADAVWDEDTTGHYNASKYGYEALQGAGASAASIADAVWNEAASGHTDAGKAGEQLWTDIDAVKAKTDDLTFSTGTYIDANVLVWDDAAITDANSNPDVDVVSMGTGVITANATAADCIDASALAASAVDEIADNTMSRYRGEFGGTPGTTGGSSTDLVQTGTDHWKDNLIYILDGNAGYQVARITDFNPATDSLTWTPAFTTAPAATDSFAIISILAVATSATISDADMAAIADTVWGLAQADQATAGTFGEIATEIATIKTATDKLTFTVTNVLDANITHYEGVTGVDAEIQSEVADALNALDVMLAADTTALAVNIADAVWNEDTTSHQVANSFGEYLQDTTVFQGGASGLTAGAIADAVWDEDTTGHYNLAKYGYEATGSGAAGATAAQVRIQVDEAFDSNTVNVGKIDGTAAAATNLEKAFDGVSASRADPLWLTGINVVATGNDTAMVLWGKGTGHGMIALGGDGGGGGIVGMGTSGNSRGLHFIGFGSGTGMRLDGGATGIGLEIKGGGTSGEGVQITSTSGNAVDIDAASGDGVEITGTTADIDADITGTITTVTGNVDGSVGSVTAGVSLAAGQFTKISDSVDYEKVWYAIDTTNIDSSDIGDWLVNNLNLDAGTGAYADTILCLSNADTTAIDGMRVRIFESDGVTGAGFVRTGSDGMAIFSLGSTDPDTFLVRAYLNGWTQDTLPDTTIVSSSGGTLDTVWFTPFATSLPDSAGLCKVFGNIYTAYGQAVAGALITISPVQSGPARYGNLTLVPTKFFAETNSNGVFEVYVIPSASVIFKSGKDTTYTYEATIKLRGGVTIEYPRPFTIPDTTEYELNLIIGE